jgi:uncharacterized membrane protein
MWRNGLQRSSLISSFAFGGSSLGPGGRGIAGLVLAYLLPLLLTIAVVTPPWQNPDEPLHMARAVQVAHGGVLGYRAWTTAGGLSDPAIYDAYQPVRHVAMRPAERLSQADLAASAAVHFGRGTSYLSFPNTAQYPPFFYVADAIAYWIGRAARLSIDHTLLLARAANATLFSFAAAAAMAYARRTRWLLAAVLLMPATLALACSASQDAPMLAATSLSVALLDRVVDERRAATRTEGLVIAVLLAGVAMARPPYAGFIAILLLLDPRPTSTSLRIAGAAATCVLAWCLLVALHTTVPLSQADWHAQLGFLAANPGQIPSIIGATARAYLGDYWQQLIGVLGWTDTPLPRAYDVFATLVLILAAAASAAGSARMIWAPLAGCMFAAVAIFVLQYLTWTWPGQLVITGVLGRYFTPLAMVLALALPAWRWAARLRSSATLGLVALAAVTPAVMLHAILFRYYVP